MIGGIFMILGAIGFIIVGIAGILSAIAPAPAAPVIPVGGSAVAPLGVLGLLISAFCAVSLILGQIELIGGICAIKRTHFVFVIIVAILSLSILGLIFVAVGRKEFVS